MAYERKRELLDPCPVELVIEIIGGKWKARIIHLLLVRHRSFAELRRSLPGITQQVLATQLSSLVNDEIVLRRKTVNGSTIGSVYSLSELGESLVPVIETMSRWGIERLRHQGIEWKSDNH